MHPPEGIKVGVILCDLFFPLPFIPSSLRRRLYEPKAARGGETIVHSRYPAACCREIHSLCKAIGPRPGDLSPPVLNIIEFQEDLIGVDHLIMREDDILGIIEK